MSTPEIRSETYDPADFELGGSEVHFVKVTILAGQNLAAGTVLGESVTATKFDAPASAAELEPYVLLNDIDATGGDVEANVYSAGLFDFNRLTLPAGVTLKQLQAAWKGTPMHAISATAP